jgi:hypothetical protein
MSTEDRLCLFIDCMYPIKKFDNLYIGKMGHTTA